MTALAKVGAALLKMFGPLSQIAAAESGVIQRTRKFTALSLARTFVLGFLQNPQATDETLAQMAAQCDAEVTPQAIEQRHSPRLVDFLQKLFCEAARLVVGSDRALAPILERFACVTVLDSSAITLPDEMQQQFRGCGGSYGSGAAAMKLQTELDLRSGALHVTVESGRSPDSATSRQSVRRGKGSLRITDLGYFNSQIFAAMTAAQEHFLSRLQFGTNVLTIDGQPVSILPWLEEQPGPFVDRPILLGQQQCLPCRLIAWRLPQEQADRRRQKLRQEILRKRGQEPSAERLAWCDWTILVTSVPEEQLTPQEAVIMYRARWQVELLFKRWKSQGLVAELNGSTAVRQMVRVWSRLLAVVVQQWLLLPSIWGDPTKSLSKASEAVRQFAGRLAATVDDPLALEQVLYDLRKTLAKTCRRNSRSRPGTFELLNSPEALDFRLT
jgi:hypothetical protein